MEVCSWDNERIGTYIKNDKIRVKKYIKKQSHEDEEIINMPFYMTDDDYDKFYDDEY
jgi:hypothetical protein